MTAHPSCGAAHPRSGVSLVVGVWRRVRGSGVRGSGAGGGGGAAGGGGGGQRGWKRWRSVLAVGEVGELGPGPADHGEARGPDRVLAALLRQHGIRRALAGAKQPAVLDLAVELPDGAQPRPAEVRAPQPTAAVVGLRPTAAPVSGSPARCDRHPAAAFASMLSLSPSANSTTRRAAGAPGQRTARTTACGQLVRGDQVPSTAPRRRSRPPARTARLRARSTTVRAGDVTGTPVAATTILLDPAGRGTWTSRRTRPPLGRGRVTEPGQRDSPHR